MGDGSLFYWSSLFLAGAILLFGALDKSYFIIGCAVYGILLSSIQLRLVSLRNKDKNIQKKSCKPVGFFLLFSAVGLIVFSILIPILYYVDISAERAYFVIGLSGVLSACLLFQTFSLRKDDTLAARFLRLTIIASWPAPLLLIIVLLLHITTPDEAVMLGCISGAILGGMAFLIAVNMIIVSFCEYKSTIDSIRTIRHLVKKHQLIFTRFSILKDTFLVVGKTAISMISLSFFMFINAFYSAGMGIARYIAIKMHTQGKEKQIINYRYVGIIISLSSICYVLYSVRLFFGGKTGVYDMNVALVIALYTFIEFGINIKEAFRLRKSKALEAKALRAISFASTLICFVLTQTAIMSFAAESNSNFANALSGMAFGILAALVGLYIIADSFLHMKTSVL